MELSPLEQLQVLIAQDQEVVDLYSGRGKCKGCGQCCSRILPVSQTERFIIRAEAKRLNIKPRDYIKGALNMMCPFLDEKQECMIYDHRPKICQIFRCDRKPYDYPENIKFEGYSVCDLNELIRDSKVSRKNN